MEFEFVKMIKGRNLLTCDHSDCTNILLFFRLKLDALMDAAVRIVTILLAKVRLFLISTSFSIFSVKDCIQAMKYPCWLMST